MELQQGSTLVALAVALVLGVGLIIAARAFRPRLYILGFVVGAALVAYSGIVLYFLIKATHV